ncbi:MAG: biotin--[acetyl-CoA-carboxylase] ligase [Planctomycetota bacterium]
MTGDHEARRRAFAAVLPRGGLGRRLHFHPTVDSTNARALAELDAGRAEDGDLHLAHEQTAGRGSRGRRWHSPPGAGLWMSLVRLAPPPTPAAFWPALALVRALRAEGLDARVKWPNDVLVGARKIAGVLVEACYRGAVPQGWVIGLGVDLTIASFPPEVEVEATSFLLESGRAPDEAALLARLLDEMGALAADPHSLVEVLRAEGGLLGRRFNVRRGGERFTVVARDLDAEGHLVVDRDDGGRETWISSGELDLRPAD